MQLYDRMPVPVPLSLQLGGVVKPATVYWVQGDSNPAYNSNSIIIADQLIAKHFGGAFFLLSSKVLTHHFRHVRHRCTAEEHHLPARVRLATEPGRHGLHIPSAIVHQVIAATRCCAGQYIPRPVQPAGRRAGSNSFCLLSAACDQSDTLQRERTPPAGRRSPPSLNATPRPSAESTSPKADTSNAATKQTKVSEHGMFAAAVPVTTTEPASVDPLAAVWAQ